MAKTPTTADGTALARPRKKKTASPREGLETRLMRGFGARMESASWESCRRSGARFGLFFHHAMRGRRALALANIRVAFPDISAREAEKIARKSAQNFGMTFCEFLHLPAASPADIREYSHYENDEIMRAAVEEGRGVLALTAHLGNWEVMGARAAMDFPVTVMSRPTSNVGVQSYLEEIRAGVSLPLVSKWNTARASLRVLHQKGVLAIMPDQWSGGDLKIPFFGHETRFVSSLARLSLLTDAPIVPIYGVRKTPWLSDGRTIVTVRAPLPLASTRSRDPEEREALVRDATLLVAREIEEMIRLRPEQWLWVHRRWRIPGLTPVKPKKKKRKKKKAAD